MFTTNQRSTSPKAGFVNITPDLLCNNDCIYCHEHDRERDPKGVISVDGICEMTLKALRRFGLSRVGIGGGEPTLYPGLTECVRRFKQHGVAVSLLTNGRRLSNRTRLDELLEAGVVHFHIPLHSDSEAIHDAIAQARGSFRETTSALRNLAEAQNYTVVDLSIAHVMHKLNFSRLEQFAHYILDFYPDYVLLSYCIISADSPDGQLDLLVPLEQILPKVFAACDTLKANGRKVYVDNIPPCVMRGKEEVCMDFQKLNHLNIVGLKTMGRSRENRCDMLQQSINAHQRTFAPQCRSCAIRPYCGGLYRSYMETLGVSAFVPYTSEEIRNRLSAQSASIDGGSQ